MLKFVKKIKKSLSNHHHPNVILKKMPNKPNNCYNHSSITRNSIKKKPLFPGSILLIHGRKFEIVGADDRVLAHMDDERSAPMPKHCELSLRNYFREKNSRQQ